VQAHTCVHVWWLLAGVREKKVPLTLTYFLYCADISSFPSPLLSLQTVLKDTLSPTPGNLSLPRWGAESPVQNFGHTMSHNGGFFRPCPLPCTPRASHKPLRLGQKKGQQCNPSFCSRWSEAPVAPTFLRGAGLPVR
jgi:hypothetical protein